MKKIIFVITAGIFICASLPAQSGQPARSDSWTGYGAGLTISGAFNNGLTGSGINTNGDYVNVDFTMRIFDVGITMFFDFKYVEIMLGSSVFAEMTYHAENAWRYNSLDMAVLGKYPIKLSESRYTFYPMLGGTYKMVYSVKDTGTNARADDPLDFSMLWFNAGFGIDHELFGNFYTKTQILYGIRLPTKFEKDLKKIIESVPLGSTKIKFNHGVSFQFLLGFKM
jgi:hypothetical protein